MKPYPMGCSLKNCRVTSLVLNSQDVMPMTDSAPPRYCKPPGLPKEYMAEVPVIDRTQLCDAVFYYPVKCSSVAGPII